MIQKFRKFIYSLGGADYNVIQHSTNDTKKQYRNLGWSVILCTLIALISGADFTHQYTSSVPITIAGALLFGTLVFSFDYFLINSNSTSTFFKLLRIPVAVANVLLGTLALMVMLTQSKIDNKILLENTGKITKCDSTYQISKLQRYEAYQNKVTDKDHYHNTVCFPEAQNGYAGTNYGKKHTYCITQDSLLSIEKVALDSAEVPFFKTYSVEREALGKLTSNDIFEKGNYLPAIFKENWVALLIALCVFIIATYVETQSLIIKFSLDPNDEYHQDLAKFKANHKLKSDQRLKTMQDHNDKMSELKTEKQNTDDLSKWAEEKIASTLKKAPLAYKLNEYKRIFREQGMPELSDEIANVQNAISNGSDMDKVMYHLINKINQN
jgi:transcription initiation factor TFIIIB Brf1 subunit/transcription initiation factor TFIIB